MPSPESLIEELIHNSNASGQRMLERRLSEVAVWYYKNIGGIPRDNLAAKQAFLEKAFWIMLEVNAMLVERLHDLEGTKTGAKHLWLPRGVKVNGDLRELG